MVTYETIEAQWHVLLKGSLFPIKKQILLYFTESDLDIKTHEYTGPSLQFSIPYRFSLNAVHQGKDPQPKTEQERTQLSHMVRA